MWKVGEVESAWVILATAAHVDGKEGIRHALFTLSLHFLSF